MLPGAVADALARGRSDLCSHGSLLYASPAAARADAAEIRKKDPTSRHLRPYECDDMPGRYHLGKIADVVVAGLTSADELYERTKERHARPR